MGSAPFQQLPTKQDIFLTNNYIKHKAQWRVNMTNKRADEKKENAFPFYENNKLFRGQFL